MAEPSLPLYAQLRDRLRAGILEGRLLPQAKLPSEAELSAEHGVSRITVRQALGGPNGLFDPDVSGLGGDVRVDAIHQRVLTVPGVQAVRVRHLRRLRPDSPERAHAGLLAVDADEVAILQHPYGKAFPSGLLTVTVCEARP